MPVVIPDGYCAVDIQILYTPSTHLDHCTLALGVTAFTVGSGLPNDIMEALDGTLDVFLSVDHFIQRVRCYDDLVEDFSTSAPIQGLGVSDILPSNCAWLLQKRGTLIGRANRGRMFIPGPSEAAVDGNGLIDNAVLTSVQGAADDMLTALQDIELVENVVILHGSAALEPTPVTSFTIDSHISTQRRRMR